MLTMEDMREFFYNIEKCFVVMEIEKLSWDNNCNIPIPIVSTKKHLLGSDTYNGKKLKSLRYILTRGHQEQDYLSYKMGELYEKHHKDVDFEYSWEIDNNFYKDVISKYNSEDKKLKDEAVLLIDTPFIFFSIFKEEDEQKEPNDSQA